MNIALIGAPGSGKTSLAYRLRRALDDAEDCIECGKEGIAIVDNYVSEIERDTHLALGPITGYLGNLYVALGRYARERTARSKHAVTITCGTLVETAVYTAMHFVSLTDVLNDEQKAMEAPRIDGTLRILACLYQDVVDYDHAFYLPPGQQPGEELEQTHFFDRQLQAALEGFKIMTVTPLINPETQLEDALKAMGKVKDETANS